MSAVDNTFKNSSSDKKHIVTISLDAMGGDNAPESVIKGASLALDEMPNLRFKIYGNKKKIGNLIDSYPNLANSHQFIHTEEVIDNSEKPSNALRRGRNSSMYLAIHAVKAGEAAAVVSAGNTGALMALSKFQLGTLPGIDRPAIGGILPTEKGYCAMLDLGANVHCEAENLFEFAVMGNAFARAVLGVANPSVGLLNVGAEKSKGNETVKAALNLIQESGIELNLFGFVEGDDISLGTTDVVVADGFSGNIALKSIEGLAKLYTKILKTELGRDPLGWIAALFAIPAFKRIKKKMDPRNYNGAMFLGLNGIVIKSHGSTEEVGFANAIKVAYKLARNNINEHITREMISSGHLVDDNDGDIEIDLDS
jgi:glycerol-3-phosphate acyltransferase PlsX